MNGTIKGTFTKRQERIDADVQLGCITLCACVESVVSLKMSTKYRSLQAKWFWLFYQGLPNIDDEFVSCWSLQPHQATILSKSCLHPFENVPIFQELLPRGKRNNSNLSTIHLYAYMQSANPETTPHMHQITSLGERTPCINVSCHLNSTFACRVVPN
jgi:hypothetical protein